jgi:hypothetical protein
MIMGRSGFVRVCSPLVGQAEQLTHYAATLVVGLLDQRSRGKVVAAMGHEPRDGRCDRRPSHQLTCESMTTGASRMSTGISMPSPSIP